MASERQQKNEPKIMPTGVGALDHLCPDLGNWPELWAVEPTDVAVGQSIIASIRPFLLDLLQQGLAKKTLARHRDHLQMLGGEIIRRRYDDPKLAQQSVSELLFNFVEEDGGPLIWPRITESAQNSFDATCRKLYRFLSQQKSSR
jgi:hypothetical protein